MASRINYSPVDRLMEGLASVWCHGAEDAETHMDRMWIQSRIEIRTSHHWWWWNWAAYTHWEYSQTYYGVNIYGWHSTHTPPAFATHGRHKYRIRITVKSWGFIDGDPVSEDGSVTGGNLWIDG